ncbi:MAG: LysR substrate-binding domain-containing protein [Pseudomonadota bacterium]
MINPRHLASLEAIAAHGTFSAAGDATGRSHSAISLHIKALEEELGTIVIDRAARPLALTSDGLALLEQAQRFRRVMEDIHAIAHRDVLSGTLAVGIVPTVMSHLAPPALAEMRSAHPAVQLEIRTGLSGELARAVALGELDAAVITGPDLPPEDLTLDTISEDGLVVIAPDGARGRRDAELLTSHPFIWFSRKTWAGQQIERRLLDRGIRVRAAMEVDSLEAISALVAHRLGVSIVPEAGLPETGLVRVPFCDPQATRRVVLATRPRSTKGRLTAALLSGLRAATAKADGTASSEG